MTDDDFVLMILKFFFPLFLLTAALAERCYSGRSRGGEEERERRVSSTDFADDTDFRSEE